MLIFAESGSLTVGLLFWILFIVGLVFYGFMAYRAPDRGYYGAGILWWVLIFLLGCGVFGFPVKF